MASPISSSIPPALPPADTAATSAATSAGTTGATIPAPAADLRRGTAPPVPRALGEDLPLSWLATALAALLLVVCWAAVAGVLHLKRQDALAAEQRQNANLARVLAEQTVRVLAGADQALLRLRDLVAEGEAADLVRLANETGLTPQILVQLSRVDEQGRFAGSNLDPDGRRTGPVDLSQREHVRAHLGAAAAADPRPAQAHAQAQAASGLQDGGGGRDETGLFVGKPVLGKVSGQWTIQLSRRLVAPDGSTAGVAVASLDPGYFERVYAAVSLGRQGSVALIGLDRALRARVYDGRAGQGLGTPLPGDAALAQQVRAGSLDLVDDGHTTDGVARVIGARQVAGYPLVVLVATRQAEALADWADARRALLLLAAVLSGVVVLTTALFVLGLRRLEQAAAALRRSEARAQAANQAKSEFLAAISHELRTPLTAIRGFSELMERRLEDPRGREQAGMIRKGAEHLNALLSEILDLARVEAGAMPLNMAATPLRPLLQGTVDFFALVARDKGLELALHLAPDLPTALDCDSLRLKQILNNLLSNALKFTTQGGVMLRVQRQGGQLLFEVEDTGPGIPEALHERVFERFRQADARIAHQHGGSGLGLALARALAERMAGRLTLRSAPGQGACFTLALPLTPPLAPAPAAAPRP